MKWNCSPWFPGNNFICSALWAVWSWGEGVLGAVGGEDIHWSNSLSFIYRSKIPSQGCLLCLHMCAVRQSQRRQSHKIYHICNCSLSEFQVSSLTGRVITEQLSWWQEWPSSSPPCSCLLFIAWTLGVRNRLLMCRWTKQNKTHEEPNVTWVRFRSICYTGSWLCSTMNVDDV